MSKKRKPVKGDKVNDVRRAPNANGFVQRILYSEDGPEEVLVKFDNSMEFYDYDEFTYSWTDRFGGCYILQT